MTLSADIPAIHHASSPELVVINDFSGALVGAEQLPTQLAAFTLALYRQFMPTPSICSSSIYAKAPAFRDRSPEANPKSLTGG
jgi:hypothetical protein